MKKESFVLKIWNVLWPLFIYIIAQNVITIFGMLILMIVNSLLHADEAGMVGVNAITDGAMEMFGQYAILFVLISAVICIPIYYWMYKKDSEKTGKIKRNIPMELKDYFAIIVCGATIAIATNSIISITPLPQIFTGYETTNEIIFGGGIILQILSAGIFGCIVEEMSLRGITYLRMKQYWGKKRAIFLSALVFGIYHFNVVQAVYAFVLGLFFAWVYERYDSLWAPIIAHMSANLCVILLGSSTVVTHLLENMVGYCLMTCISILIFYYGWRWMKQTNPLVELEFVEKEPDSLEQLAKEYKEQGREEGKT